MKRSILIHPDPRLKKVCAPVPDLSDDLRKLADDMLETMYDAPGIGLAAPQVGVLDRLIVLDDGHIVEQGAHSELVASGGLYSQLWSHQSGGFLGVE